MHPPGSNLKSMQTRLRCHMMCRWLLQNPQHSTSFSSLFKTVLDILTHTNGLLNKRTSPSKTRFSRWKERFRYWYDAEMNQLKKISHGTHRRETGRQLITSSRGLPSLNMKHPTTSARLRILFILRQSKQEKRNSHNQNFSVLLSSARILNSPAVKAQRFF